MVCATVAVGNGDFIELDAVVTGAGRVFSI